VPSVIGNAARAIVRLQGRPPAARFQPPAAWRNEGMNASAAWHNLVQRAACAQQLVANRCRSVKWKLAGMVVLAGFVWGGW